MNKFFNGFLKYNKRFIGIGLILVVVVFFVYINKFSSNSLPVSPSSTLLTPLTRTAQVESVPVVVTPLKNKDLGPAKTLNEYGRLQIRKFHQNLVPIGKSFISLPLSPEEMSARVDASTANILFLVMIDGKPMDYQKDVKISMYARAGDAEPLYSYTAQEWKKMHITTRCPEDVLSYIKDSDSGDALFCNHSLDLSKIHLFVVSEDGKKGDLASSYSVNFTKSNMTAISIGVD